MFINIDILNFYMIMLTICALISSLFTQAIKITCKNKNIKYSSNLIALIDSIIVGGGGTIIVYIYNDIPFTLKNIITIVCITVLTWIGCTVGFDKVKQTFQQILKLKEN